MRKLRKKIVGLMGCTVNNKNLGCMALSYSLVNCINEIAKKESIDVDFVFFDNSATNTAITKLKNQLGLLDNQATISKALEWDFHTLKAAGRTIKHLPDTMKSLQIIKSCDFIVDLTQGDSFSDIYGQNRFYRWTGAKALVEKTGIPLVLGPQTYGPFFDDKVKKFAKSIIESAAMVIARDEESKEYVESFCSKSVLSTTDLAFMLPYKKADIGVQSKIRIGINPSGLLCRNKTDDSSFDSKLKTDYEKYMNHIIGWLKKQQCYEIHMISHVGNEAIESMGGIDGVIYHQECATPIEVKSLISSMDIFVGARMHATIGAVSSGVATIPVAYSRKFSGLYGSLGYPYIIDLQSLDTEKAIELTKEYILGYIQLQSATRAIRSEIQTKSNLTQEIFSDLLRGEV